MRTSHADRRRGSAAGVFALLAAGLLAGPGLAAQTPRDIVSKSVSVGRDAATLELEFATGSPLTIALTRGEVVIDGETAGTFESAGAVDVAWRSLLGFAVALDDGPLARTLIDWSPPEELSEEAAAVAARIDEALEGALQAETPPSPPTPAAAPPAPAAPDAPAVETGIELRSLVSLLDRTDALVGLAEALEDVDLDEIRLVVGEDLTIGADEEVDATVVVVDADLEVEGRVRGDVVLIDGDLRLAPGSRIDGDVRHIDGTVVDQGGRVDGEVYEVGRVDGDLERRLRDELRSEIRSELRSEIRAATRGERSDRGESFIGRVFGGIGGALGNLFTVLVVAVIGGLVVHFAGTNLDAVAETARRTPGRALVVGTAGSFLILPAFVLGILALAISIIGIPALILWIPLFPVAVTLGLGLGYLAVFRNVGVWVARQRFPYMSWVRITNPVTLVAGGALALTAPFIAAELVSVFPWTGALEVLLRVTGVLLSVMAALLGFGAVLLTRGGRRPEFFDDDLFGGWSFGGRTSPGGSGGTPADDAEEWPLEDTGVEGSGEPAPAPEGTTTSTGSAGSEGWDDDASASGDGGESRDESPDETDRGGPHA